jgi:hypothetical protein
LGDPQSLNQIVFQDTLLRTKNRFFSKLDNIYFFFLNYVLIYDEYHTLIALS